ncbi:Vacuolar transporter chaperone 4 [Seminavis robusta]|uniref:Vacuolar transporter chaperone 4 n=1 Tax=Seminavis robusta TaxID=568900 RepID=A0A9N8DYQ3_9STRA|nr:Vacuolar transporter chaperone 4 [Seminavis robusta]|eukprot:Sro458_g147070.1 Vacuolar transporter chaperone 4 (727) ;mRNA; f:26542-28920
MKYGEHLKANVAPEYGPEPYLDYDKLDEIIRVLSKQVPSSADQTSRQISLTTPPQTNAQGLAADVKGETEETFLKALDGEMAKVESFTLKKVTALRDKIRATEGNIRDSTDIAKSNGDPLAKDSRERLLDQAEDIAEDFLRLEKFVNINFMGFHKILKKHDKHLPNNPCKNFYVNRMHAQAWVRGDYSDLVVRLSHIYSSLRQDDLAKEPGDEANQSFLRSTTKYWVKTEDVSRVKYAVLKHLPLFLQKTSTGETDSQFTNSVYLDNDSLELYHGRLDKTPGAIALRLRWYGVGDPKLVFVERKTHNEKWTGEVSVKERFMIDESEVHQVLTNTYPIEEKRKAMLAKGKSQKEADEWEQLVREITQVCVSKQLVPTCRTQCMRTAFQIPFDATVRVSLDTNLCMISERGYDLHDMKVWHRDPSWVLEPNEITRFPHAVLEIKLQLTGGNMTPPQWVTELQNSGLLYECHKYSKYVHGCSVLLPDDVRSVPYWVDDVSLRDSINASGGSRILADSVAGVGSGANEVYSHLLPFGDVSHNRSATAVGRTAASKMASKGLIGDKAMKGDGPGLFNEPIMEDDFLGEDDDYCCSWMFPFCSRSNNYAMAIVAPTSIQKIEPKVFLANERTYLHWLHHGVILSTIASGILAFSEDSGETWGEVYALILLVVSLGFCVYALHVYLWRTAQIRSRIPGRWDDPIGPMALGAILAVILTVNFGTKLWEISQLQN